MEERANSANLMFLFVTLPFAAAFLLGTQHEDALIGILDNPASLSSPSNFLVIALSICVVTLVVVSSLARWRTWTNGSPMLLACMFLLIVGLGLYVYQVYFYPELQYLVSLSAVFVGISGALTMLLWGKALSMIESRMLIIDVAASIALSGLLSLISKAVFWQVDLTIVAVAYVLISTFPLLSIFDKGDSPEDTLYDVFPKRKRVAIAIWKPLLGTAVCLVVLACVWGDAIPELAGSNGTSLYAWRMAGIMTGSTALLVLTLAMSEHRIYPVLIVQTPPAAAVLLILSWLTALPGVSLYGCSNFFFGLASGLLFTLTLRALAEISHEHDAALALFGEAGVFLFLLMVGVIALSWVSPILCPIVASALIFVYAAIVNFDFGRKEPEGVEVEETIRREIEFPDNVDEAFDWLAYIGGLNAAEREILPLLARGHGSDYISNALSMSYDTVQKRTRNIYDRLGVRHRSELVALIRWHV